MIRYVLLPSRIAERAARQDYLCEALHRYFVLQPGLGNSVELRSFPFSPIQYTFLCGHNYEVDQYLQNHRDSISGEILVIISCTPLLLRKRHPWIRGAYFCKVDHDGYANTRYGNAFGFNFDVTDSEINFYNSDKTNLDARLQSCFIKLR